MSRSNIPIKTGPDWGALLLVVLSLALATLAGIIAFRWSRDFFATTAVFQVGDAPPLPDSPAALTQTAAATAQQGPASTPSTPVAPTLPAVPAAVKWQGTRQVTLLVMGLDYRDWLEGVDVPRTDTMILFAIDPDFTVVIDVGLKKDPGAGYGDTIYLFGQL